MAEIEATSNRYDAVRKHKPSAYVILSNQLGIPDPNELLSFAGNFNHVVIDMHYYNLYSEEYSNMNVQRNINYIKNQRASALKTVTTSKAPLSFVNQSYVVVAATAVVYYKSFLFGQSLRPRALLN
ncbi:hypothetical protein CFP56_025245 [Quercus suber]|uniref:Mannan endo-1,4-beta-mannosidase n=1 Tax=Quercus suber TaxID=58331 RepID=A0AAW0K4V5_QUESU